MVQESLPGPDSTRVDHVPGGVPDVPLTGYICQRCKTIFQSEFPQLICGECSGRIELEMAQRNRNEAFAAWVKADRKYRKAKQKRKRAAEAYNEAISALTRVRYGRPK